jgi:hypothetical protein
MILAQSYYAALFDLMIVLINQFLDLLIRELLTLAFDNKL